MPQHDTTDHPYLSGIAAARSGRDRRSRPRHLSPADRISWDAGYEMEMRVKPRPQSRDPGIGAGGGGVGWDEGSRARENL